jgi:hypothetical protein
VLCGERELAENVLQEVMLTIGWSPNLQLTPGRQWADFDPATSMDDVTTWFDATVAIP